VIMKRTLVVLSFLFLASFAVCAAHDRILLKDVGAITLTKGQMTRAQRSYPVPQLSCVGGSAQSSTYHPTVVQCQNRGFDGHDVQWECRGELDEAVKFGTISVNCEGFAYPDDPYVLQGSCGLEYTLEYTRKGEGQRYGEAYGHGQVYSSHYGSTSYSHDNESSGWGTLVAFLILVGVIYLTLRVLCAPRGGYIAPVAPAAAPGFGPGGYGGGSSAYPSAPPYESPGFGSPSYVAPGPAPGFWSGLSMGGMLGYLLRPRTSYYAPSYGMRPTYGGATFGGAFGGSSSGSSRTSSGFGGTKRR